jgi:hypothetical protein
MTMRYTLSSLLRIQTSPLTSSRALTPPKPRLILHSSPPPPALKPLSRRTFHTSLTAHQSSSPSRPPKPHTDFYRTHGRALFKALTLAFFTYQVCYWAWLVLETEEIKDQKSREIKSLEGEVRLLDEGRNSHISKG